MLMRPKIPGLVLILVGATTAKASPRGHNCPVSVVEGVEAQQLDNALRSTGVAVVTLPEQKGEMAFAHSVTCGPLTQGASCDVSYKGGSQTVEKAFALTKLLANSGASEVQADGHATYTVQNVHCLSQITASDGLKKLSCWFEPVVITEKETEFL